jgi:hypothetical protein
MVYFTVQNLLEKRSEDSKAVKRVQLMRKSAKSASKSVMSDANDDHLACKFVFLIDLPLLISLIIVLVMQQPDEDDYGFSSKTESEMYEKMVKGFVAQNDDRQFSKSKKPTMNLSATKVHSNSLKLLNYSYLILNFETTVVYVYLIIH